MGLRAGFLNIREGLLFRNLELLNPFGELRACLER
jgi:hypothetical protein